MATKYMHTIDGKPAAFDERYNYLYQQTQYNQAAPLADSLRQIRREQETAEKDRKAMMGGAYEPSNYGYIKVQA